MWAQSDRYSNNSPLYRTDSDELRVEMKNSRAIAVLWGVFSICFCIIDCVVFFQPHWLGDTKDSPGTGYFGLWKYCQLIQDGQGITCAGTLSDFTQIPSMAFRMATVLVGLSVALSIVSIVTMPMFCFVNTSTTFHICGWLQALSGMTLLGGCLIYPIGWNISIVQDVCGPLAGEYSQGNCAVRWAFVLAGIGVADSVVLSILAFVLGSYYVRMLPKNYLNSKVPSEKMSRSGSVVPEGYAPSHYSHGYGF
ncbi:lipoma HMGIC fusion partner-like 3 protein [Varroa jacobsoni]|uniref:Uncharacterized protein n=1 Tax=Varroa destructor TaxID=109461 RepID=A0A7M7KJ97_VARDE|nr:lipoma HMGIC fusion partner-like 3 protein [Varroa destructor]XP_022667704.1 lipoma HMGIC fusion partner-like 3 protein [Varroa destructor]XP_022695464.1 lipoma HMGIC fusion partner-like 3 protein [Varroa jacobsoni]XP_022695465.1 lipoma HMGIC fusion partner-like 3 protein [Varroa jacobsoni]XP_022695466.1 lipoma HMGIC fusion partner-like 3 protein [Varroa jacobsoni]